jgi:hypothetical protein
LEIAERTRATEMLERLRPEDELSVSIAPQV